jgi:hypothetical protein
MLQDHPLSLNDQVEHSKKLWQHLHPSALLLTPLKPVQQPRLLQPK